MEGFSWVTEAWAVAAIGMPVLEQFALVSLLSLGAAAHKGGGTRMPESVEFLKLGRLERYRIAQTFHELTASGLEHSIAAAQISIRHGVSDGDVIASAAEFKREPFWRL